MYPATKTIDAMSKQLGKLSVSAARVMGLPTEIIEHITSHMDLDTIRAFRLCSRSTAQLAGFHFKRDYQHTIRTDFCLEDFQVFERLLAKNPKAMCTIDTLSVTGKAAEERPSTLCESPRMGAGFHWKRSGEVLDMDQPAVKNWHKLLARIGGDLKHFRLNVDLGMVILPGSVQDDSSSSTQLTLWDVFLIAIPVIKSNSHAVESLDILGYNFYRGNQQWSTVDPPEKDMIDQLCHAPKNGWPNLSSKTLRHGETNEMYRFADIISHAPNLKRIHLHGLFYEAHFDEIVRCAPKFRLEELHIEDMRPLMEKLCNALRAVGGTLKKLVLQRVNMPNWPVFLGALSWTPEFSALEEFTLEEAYTIWNGDPTDVYKLRFPYKAGTVGFSAPRGAKLAYTLQGLEYTLQDGDKGAMYANLTYSGPGMEGFFSQLSEKACLVPSRHFHSRALPQGVHRF